MTQQCDNHTTGSPTRWDHETFPGRPDTITVVAVDSDGDPAAFGTVEIRVDGTVFSGVPVGDGSWEVTIEWPKVNVLPMQLVVDGRIATSGVLRVTTGGVCAPTTDPLTVTTGGDTTLELTVLGGGGGDSQPPQAGDGIEVAGFVVSVDATVVREGDERLSDARQPLPHSHSATDVSGLAAVATTGDYSDLSGAPTIPSTPAEVGADPAGTAQGLVDGLAAVASTGSYDDLDDRPTIPSTAAEVGADPAGAADSAVQDHVAASDPHGDRSYTDQTVAGLDADTIGAVPADGLPVRIVDDGATTTVTGAGTPADPLVITSLGGSGGGAGWELIAEVDWTEDAALDVLFDDIPQTFKHLRVEALLYRTTNGAGSASMRFNGDDTAIYSNSGDPANGTDTELNVGVVKNGGTWRTIDIPWYRRTPAGLGYRLVRITEAGTLTGGNDNYSAGVRASAWRSLDPITSIEIYTNPSTTATGSVVSLYGWKD